MSIGRTSFLAGFEITDRVSCEKAIRNGGIAGLISAAVTLLFGVAGLFIRPSDPTLSTVMNPWSLLDVALIVVLAGYVFRKSRVASTLLLAYFILSRIDIWLSAGVTAPGLVLPAIYFLYYVTAMRGTYLWHSKYHARAEQAAALN